MTGSDVTPPHGGDVIVALGGPLDKPVAEYAVVTDGGTCSPCSNLSRVGSDEAPLDGGDGAAAKAVVLSAIMVSAVLGNLLVIISVLRYDRLRRVANSFIVSLAFADLLVAVLVMPFNASQVPTARQHTCLSITALWPSFLQFMPSFRTGFARILIETEKDNHGY